MIVDFAKKAEATKVLEWMRSRLQTYASIGVVFDLLMLHEIERKLDLVSRLATDN